MVHMIVKEQLVAFYDEHWNDMKQYILGHYITGINAHNIRFRLVNKQPVEVSSKAEFLALVRQKYLTQIIPEFPLIAHQKETKELLIDMDSPFEMEQNKQYIIDCFKFALQNLPKNLNPDPYAVFTGHRSFHLRIQINKFISMESAKDLVAEKIIAPFYKKYGDVITFPPDVRMPSREAKSKKVHLDMSSMKARGELRCPYSFYDDSAMFALPLRSIKEIEQFKLKDATVEVVDRAEREVAMQEEKGIRGQRKIAAEDQRAKEIRNAEILKKRKQLTLQVDKENNPKITEAIEFLHEFGCDTAQPPITKSFKGNPILVWPFKETFKIDSAIMKSYLKDRAKFKSLGIKIYKDSVDTWKAFIKLRKKDLSL